MRRLDATARARLAEAQTHLRVLNEAGRSYTEIADELGVALQSVSSWLHSQRAPTVERLAAGLVPLTAYERHVLEELPRTPAGIRRAFYFGLASARFAGLEGRRPRLGVALASLLLLVGTATTVEAALFGSGLGAGAIKRSVAAAVDRTGFRPAINLELGGSAARRAELSRLELLGEDQ